MYTHVWPWYTWVHPGYVSTHWAWHVLRIAYAQLGTRSRGTTAVVISFLIWACQELDIGMPDIFPPHRKSSRAFLCLAFDRS